MLRVHVRAARPTPRPRTSWLERDLLRLDVLVTPPLFGVALRHSGWVEWAPVAAGEVLALTWSDFDADARTLRIRRSISWIGSEFVLNRPKTRQSARTVSVPLPVVAWLKAHHTQQAQRRLRAGSALRDQGFILDHGGGGPMRNDTTSAIFRRQVRALGLHGIRVPRPPALVRIGAAHERGEHQDHVGGARPPKGELHDGHLLARLEGPGSARGGCDRGGAVGEGPLKVFHLTLAAPAILRDGFRHGADNSVWFSARLSMVLHRSGERS